MRPAASTAVPSWRLDHARSSVGVIREDLRNLRAVPRTRACVPVTHGLLGRGLLVHAVERAPRVIHVGTRDVGVDLRCGQAAVAEQGLDDADVGAVLEQVRAKWRSEWK